jgi:hypothetical protein
LIECIRDLLRYDPDLRLTSRECLNHLYLQETVPRNHIAFPTGIHTASNSSIPTMPAYVNGSYPHSSTPSTSRVPLPSHTLPPPHIPEASSTHRVRYPIPISHPPLAPPQNSHMLDYRRHHPNGISNGVIPNGVTNGVRSESPVDYMDISPQVQPQPQPYHPPNVHDSPMVQDPSRQPESHPDVNNNQATLPIQLNKLGKLGSFTFGKKHAKWGLSGMFGGDKSHQNTLPPVDETRPAVSFPSRKRAKSSSTGSRSMCESSPIREQQLPTQESRDMKKMNKKEAERLHREAEQEKRKLAERKHREQARDVLHKRQQLTRKTVHDDIEWLGVGNEQRGDIRPTKGKQPASGVLRHDYGTTGSAALSATVNAAVGKFAPQQEHLSDWDRERNWRGVERGAKARRREFDDDHSMSSSEVHSISRMSSISFATVDSDPGPSRIRNRPSLFGLSRVTSKSSLRTSFDDFSPSACSSNSYSLEGQLAHDFRTQASVTSHISGSVSPPQLQLLSLSPTMSPPLSPPSSPWLQVQHRKEDLSRTRSFPYLSVSPSPTPFDPSHSPLDLNAQLPLPPPPNPYAHRPRTYGYPPNSGRTPKSAKSAINPIFKVVSYKWDSTDGLVPDDSIQPALPPPPLPPLPPPLQTHLLSPNTLPPFSELEAVAGGEYNAFSR